MRLQKVGFVLKDMTCKAELSVGVKGGRSWDF